MNLNWYWHYFKTNSRRQFVLKRLVPLGLIVLVILYRLQSSSLGGSLTTNEHRVTIPTKPAVLGRLDTAQTAPMQERVLSGRGFGDVIELPTPQFPGTLSVQDAHDPAHKVIMYILSWSPTSIHFVAPPETPSGSLRLTFSPDGKVLTSNELSLTIVAPSPHLTAISPASPKPAEVITLTGSGFGNSFPQHPLVPQAELVAGTVLFGTTVAEVKSWAATQISVLVPSGVRSSQVSVELAFQGGKITPNALPLQLSPPTPVITSLSTNEASIVSLVTVNGTGFGSPPARTPTLFPGAVYLGDIPLLINHWSDTSIEFYTPATVAALPIRVVRPFDDHEVSVQGPVVLVKAVIPKIDGLQPVAFVPGAIVEISGSNFGDAPSSGDGHFTPPGAVWFSEDSERNPSLAKAGRIINWTNNNIRLFAPLDITKALIYVRLNKNDNLTSNVTKAKVNSAEPHLSSIQPQLVHNASILTLHGTNLGEEIKTPNDGHVAYPGQVYLNGLELVPLVDKWAANQISFYIPPNATSGKIYYEGRYGDKRIRSNTLELVVNNLPPTLSRAFIDPTDKKTLVIEGEHLGYQAINPYFPSSLPGRVFVDGVTTLPVREWNSYLIKVDIGQLNVVTAVKVTSYQGQEVESNTIQVSH